MLLMSSVRRASVFKRAPAKCRLMPARDAAAAAAAAAACDLWPAGLHAHTRWYVKARHGMGWVDPYELGWVGSSSVKYELLPNSTGKHYFQSRILFNICHFCISNIIMCTSLSFFSGFVFGWGILWNYICDGMQRNICRRWVGLGWVTKTGPTAMSVLIMTGPRPSVTCSVTWSF